MTVLFKGLRGTCSSCVLRLARRHELNRFDSQPRQNANVCALPRRIGRTQMRASAKLSEGPFIETETYPKERCESHWKPMATVEA